MLPQKFNIRVYGILVNDGKLLINEEIIRGRTFIKFPGGGLDLGEGTREGLIREWKEELNLDIEVLNHFYTTDFFQQSAFDNSQIISIYYCVKVDNIPNQIVNYVENERTFWLDKNEVNAAIFTLPIDQKVGEMLAVRFLG